MHRTASPGWLRGTAEVLALRNELGRLNSLGPLQALIFSLRIADGLSQHLAQLSLGLCRFSGKGFLPLGHAHYVGMHEGELNPRWAATTGCPLSYAYGLKSGIAATATSTLTEPLKKS